MTDLRVDKAAKLTSRHQVVAVVGARGTGKTWLADQLEERWMRSGVTVLRFDSRDVREPAALLGPIAKILCSGTGALSADNAPEGQILRIILDGAEELYDVSWLDSVQEQLRALLSSESSRGSVGLLLCGRPAFRQLMGGRASPLLNLGTVIGTDPLTAEEIAAIVEVPLNTALAIHRKTGGHPELSVMLSTATHGDSQNLGAVIHSFVEEHERYLIRLVEDHGTGGVAMLGGLLDGKGTASEQELIRRGFGAAYSRGLDALDDLLASGLVGRDDTGRCLITAGLVHQSPALRTYVRAPDATIPVDEPQHHDEAAALLYLIENRLRAMIMGRLSRLDPLWWSTRVPETHIAAAELRRCAEAAAPTSAASLHPIMYLSLGEVFEILEYGDNWDEVFRLVTGTTRHALDAPRTMLTAVRHKIAHNRPVSLSDLDALRAGSRLLGLLDEQEDARPTSALGA